jgi:prevent-host-death family protein
MMETIGIRELRTRATAILRQVREQGTAYEVTYRGRVVARLVPVTQPTTTESIDAFWERLERATEEISQDWPAEVSSVEAVRDVRREL